MDTMRSAGVKVGFGTDLLGATYVQECREFTHPPRSLHSARTPAAGDLGQRRDDAAGGQARLRQAGAYADLLVVDGDPLQDISLLAENGKNLRLIVRGGAVVKDEL